MDIYCRTLYNQQDYKLDIVVCVLNFIFKLLHK